MVLQETGGGGTFAWRPLTREFKLRQMQAATVGLNSHSLVQYMRDRKTDRMAVWSPHGLANDRAVPPSAVWETERENDPVYAPCSAMGEVHNMVASIHQEPAAVQG